ncbi:MAG: hypothetical protein IJU51_04190 [Clostridia bacterium]|nr:hypothetical protein [Ruminococcus sp.]MBQ9461099.1 hypothetical protein [Clostridia bacterium]
MVKKILLCTIAFLLGTHLLSIQAFARTDRYTYNIIIESEDITDEACYIDLLIKIDKSDDRYVEKNEENMKRFGFDTEKLCKYNDNGFVSFSCHVKRNLTEPELRKNQQRESSNDFTCTLDGRKTAVGWDMIHGDYKFKVIILDENGEILQTSDMFDIDGMKKDDAYIEYNVKTNTVRLVYPFKSEDAFGRLIGIIFEAVPIIALVVFVVSIGLLILWYIRHRTS